MYVSFPSYIQPLDGLWQEATSSNKSGWGKIKSEESGRWSEVSPTCSIRSIWTICQNVCVKQLHYLIFKKILTIMMIHLLRQVMNMFQSARICDPTFLLTNTSIEDTNEHTYFLIFFVLLVQDVMSWRWVYDELKRKLLFCFINLYIHNCSSCDMWRQEDWKNILTKTIILLSHLSIHGTRTRQNQRWENAVHSVVICSMIDMNHK